MRLRSTLKHCSSQVSTKHLEIITNKTNLYLVLTLFISMVACACVSLYMYSTRPISIFLTAHAQQIQQKSTYDCLHPIIIVAWDLVESFLFYMYSTCVLTLLQYLMLNAYLFKLRKTVFYTLSPVCSLSFILTEKFRKKN